MPYPLQIALALLASAVLAALALAFLPVLGWWVQCLAGGAPVSLLALAKARMGRLPVHDLVVAWMVAHKGGADVPFGRFAELSRQGGSPVRAAIMLKAMQVAECPADPEDLFALEVEGRLAGYMAQWEAAAARGETPPEFPQRDATSS